MDLGLDHAFIKVSRNPNILPREMDDFYNNFKYLMDSVPFLGLLHSCLMLFHEMQYAQSAFMLNMEPILIDFVKG